MSNTGKGIIYSASDQELKNAIAKFRSMVPGDEKLRGTSDEEIIKIVGEYRTGNRTVSLQSFNSVSLPELSASPQCVEAVALVIAYTVGLAFSALGFDLDNDVLARSTVGGISKMIASRQGEWNRLLDNLTKASGIQNQARALWGILKFAWDNNMLSYIFDAIKAYMSWWDWVFIGLWAILGLLAAIVSDGLSIIVTIASMVPSVITIVNASITAGRVCAI